MKKNSKQNWLIPIMLLLFLPSCAQEYEVKTRVVTATAYNSIKNQTSNHPFIAAWGDTLRPDVKSIAVSRDLLLVGLTHNVEVEIDGLGGIYLVRDKMNKEWINRIDIYMGTDLKAADDWGKREVTINWKVEK